MPDLYEPIKRLYFDHRDEWMEMLYSWIRKSNYRKSLHTYGTEFTTELVGIDEDVRRYTLRRTPDVYTRLKKLQLSMFNVYLSVNRYMKKLTKRPDYGSGYWNTMFIDFDSETDIRLAHDEVWKLASFVNHRCTVVFSGNRGFHLYIVFERPFNTVSELRARTIELIKNAEDEYEYRFKTIDTIADRSRVAKVPFSIDMRTGLQCKVLHDESDTSFTDRSFVPPSRIRIKYFK